MGRGREFTGSACFACAAPYKLGSGIDTLSSVDFKVTELGNSPEFLAVARQAAKHCRDVVCLASSSAGNSASTEGWDVLGFDPVLKFRAKGAYCEFSHGTAVHRLFGNPWNVLDATLSRFEVPDGPSGGIPVGAAMGYFGYDLKNAVEPGLPQTARDDLELPDMVVGFYSTLLVRRREMDSGDSKLMIVATGFDADGNHSPARMQASIDHFMRVIDAAGSESARPDPSPPPVVSAMQSSLRREAFLQAVRQAQEWIRLGHIYQVNLSQRLTVHQQSAGGWDLFEMLMARCRPEYGGYAGFAADGLEIASASPELFLSMDGVNVATSPIKGTRPRGADPLSDRQLATELQSSEKEKAELTMITDLLRNDIGRIAEFGSVETPEFLRLKSLPHVHHLYSTVTGTLRHPVNHLQALRSCFPGGSITGAPKIRAMEIIDAIEPVSRGPYTGSLGYLGYNQMSRLNILIRSAFISGGRVHYPAGAGIVADSDPQQEYEETWHKARGFCEMLGHGQADAVTAPAHS